MNSPFISPNMSAHLYLTDAGAIHYRLKADWEDIGTGETGPILRGGPAYDEYTFEDFRVYIDHLGSVSDQIARDLAPEDWCVMTKGENQRDPADPGAAGLEWLRRNSPVPLEMFAERFPISYLNYDIDRGWVVLISFKEAEKIWAVQDAAEEAAAE